MIAVRITQLGSDEALARELMPIRTRGDLWFDPKRNTWMATPQELDTPHISFRLRPR